MLHRRHGLPEDWASIVDTHVAIWALLDAADRDAMAAAADWLLRHKHWEAANGFALTDEITVTIAMQAALLVLGLGVEEYREVSAIVVYPSSMVSRGEHAGPIAGTVSDGPIPILGEAHDRRGPILLAWDEVEAASRVIGTGNNVVLHEFAHKLDMLDGVLNGSPPLGDRVDAERWRAVCTEAFTALATGDDRPPLQPYGATNPAEFFAVATEAFFDVPAHLEQHEPELFGILRDFYGQEPPERPESPR